jgi:hypothetical protein
MTLTSTLVLKNWLEFLAGALEGRHVLVRIIASGGPHPRSCKP